MKIADPATGREINPRPVKGPATSLARGMTTSVFYGEKKPNISCCLRS